MPFFGPPYIAVASRIAYQLFVSSSVCSPHCVVEYTRAADVGVVRVNVPEVDQHYDQHLLQQQATVLVQWPAHQLTVSTVLSLFLAPSSSCSISLYKKNCTCSLFTALLT